jgi:hydrogenase-4 component F
MTLYYLIISFIIAGLLFVNRKKSVNYLLMTGFVLLHLIFTIYATAHLHQTENRYFTYDAFGILLLLTLGIILVPAVLHSRLYIERHHEKPSSRAIYFAALVILVAAISAGYLSNHIAVIWIFTEITTLSASALIYHHRNKLALEGTWKYVFICAISITFVFIGILFLSLSAGQSISNDLSFKNLIENREHLNPFWLRLAFLFIFTGFTAKAGLFPMFTAGIDAKDIAPGPAGALLASVLMNLGFTGIFRFYTVTANTSVHHWANMVIGGAAFLSLFFAATYMMRVKNVKRMFAYSGLEHMGIAMLGLAAGGIGYYAAILHVILHALAKSGLFFQYNQMYRVYQDKSIYYTGNYFKYNTSGAIVILSGFIILTAMPPSGMFISEILVFRSLMEAGYLWLLLLVLLLLTMIIWAFGKNIFKILFIPVAGLDETKLPVIRPSESYSQYALFALAVYLGLNPPPVFIRLIQESITLLSH